MSVGPGSLAVFKINSLPLRLLGVLLGAGLVVGPSGGQECRLALSDEANEISSHAIPLLFESFDLYVLLYAESTVAGAAYAITWPPYVVASPVGYGPSALGISIHGPSGETVGLGECAVGFGGDPILIAHYQAFVLAWFNATYITLEPNLSEHPLSPVYADCANRILPCTEVVPFLVGAVSAGAASFGAVKALYGS